MRNDQFVLPDGTVVQPLRTPGGYRRFTPAMLEDIATMLLQTPLVLDGTS